MIYYDAKNKKVIWSMSWEDARDLADWLEDNDGGKEDAALMRQAAKEGAGFYR